MIEFQSPLKKFGVVHSDRPKHAYLTNNKLVCLFLPILNSGSMFNTHNQVICFRLSMSFVVPVSVAARAAETSPRRVQDLRPPPLSGVAEAAEAARGETEAGTPAGV